MAVADDIFIWAVKCTNGEISTDMRLVALEVNGASVTFRYYLDKEPSDFTRERTEIIAVNFEAGLSFRLDCLDVEFVYSTEPLGHVDNLDGALFRRWENDLGTTTPDE